MVHLSPKISIYKAAQHVFSPGQVKNNEKRDLCMIKKGKEERRKEANGFRIRIRSKLSTVPSASGIGGVKIPCSRYVTYSSESEFQKPSPKPLCVNFAKKGKVGFVGFWILLSSRHFSQSRQISPLETHGIGPTKSATRRNQAQIAVCTYLSLA